MSYISQELQDTLTERARAHYSDVLPYHNWAHAQDVMSSVAALVIKSSRPEITEKGPLLVIAAAWHDADFHLQDNIAVFATKEERSAKLAIRSLPELSQEDKNLLYSGIIDTTVSKSHKENLFGEALHAADLGYFASEQEHFMERLVLMRKEWGSPDWATTVQRTRAFGNHVIAESQKSIFEILPLADAEQWMTAIENNLDSLDQKLDRGELV